MSDQLLLIMILMNYRTRRETKPIPSFEKPPGFIPRRGNSELDTGGY